MKRILSLLLLMLILVSFFTACGSTQEKSEAQESVVADERKHDGNNSGAKFGGQLTATSGDGAAAPKEKQTLAESPKKEPDASAVIGTGTAASSIPNPILSQRKIIRNANVTVEVDNFEFAYSKIKSMISAFGFVQESNIKKEKIYVNNEEKLITKGVVVIRVDKDKFESVLTDVKGLGLLLDENIRSDDVTDKFMDTESTLRQLKYEQSRLEQLLLKTADTDSIFKIEARLTQIRQDIEKLTGTLQKWADLVDLSTITINMSEKRPVAAKVEIKEKTYWDKLSSSFASSMKGVISFCGDLLIFIVQALPVLVFLSIVAFFAFFIYRKFIKKTIENSKNKNIDE